MAQNNKKFKITGLVILLVAVAATAVIWVTVANSSNTLNDKGTSIAAQTQPQQASEVSYQGQDGVDALTLLKKHAAVETKHYSFGDQVVSINGVAGNGPKYWTFYINGKMASEGAGSYKTKNSDTLSWRLQ